MILRSVHVGVGGHGQWTIDVMGKDARFKPVAVVDSNGTAARTAQYRLEQMGHKRVPTFSGLTGALSQIEADAQTAFAHAGKILLHELRPQMGDINPEPAVLGAAAGHDLHEAGA